MNEHFLWVEAVNFGATLYDTNNLSVIRGSSLKLGELGHVVRGALGGPTETELEGASRVCLRIGENAQDAERAVRAALAKDGWEHFSFVVAVATTKEAAQARASATQFQHWTVPACSAPDAVRPDQIDHVRGATSLDRMGDEARWLSTSVAARLNHGRKTRRSFFETRLGANTLEGVAFCQSFEDLVACDSGPTGAPETVRAKICVMHFDGDRFGEAAAEIGGVRFAEMLGLKLDDVLRALVDDALAAEEREFQEADPRLRIETLVWGGDDITIVVPAWRALRTLRAFYGAVDDWHAGDRRLTFTGGAVIAHYKTPVRKLVRMAEEAMHECKEGGARGCFSIDVFESADAPENGLIAHRTKTMGVGALSAAAYSFSGSYAGALGDVLCAWKKDAGISYPSRSKMFALLREAGDEDVAQLETRLEAYCDRVFGLSSDRLANWSLPLGPEPRSRALDMHLTLQLWDYAPATEEGAAL
jgi:hypothetical protein